MKQWFANIPQTLEDIVGATKFQHEIMANLIRFYKGKYTSQKELIVRLRKELDMIKVRPSTLLFDSWFTHFRSKTNNSSKRCRNLVTVVIIRQMRMERDGE